MKSITGMKSNSEIKRAAEILKRLKKEYPVAKIALEFENPFELLISTILISTMHRREGKHRF